MQDFEFHRPNTIAAAVDLIAQDEGALLFAGGQTLLPTMKQRLSMPSALVALRDVPGLSAIREHKDGYLEIGAMACHADVAASPIVRRRLPGLAVLAGKIADRHVRNRGTLGGSIANCDPAADYPAALLALSAVIATNEREIAADDFFVGLFTTALERQEIITSVRFPTAVCFAYGKFSNPASRYAIVGTAVAKKADEVHIAVTGAGADGVFCWEEAEARLSERFDPRAIDGLEPDAAMLNSDIHASAEYRASLIRVMTARTFALILNDERGD
jgi:aerobic carbon-monoxide dehydrogenase medium subunit